MRSSFLTHLTFTVFFSSALSAASIGQSTTAEGAAFAMACAGTANGSTNYPGDSYAGNFGTTTMTCHGGAGSVGGSVSGSSTASGTINGYNYSNSSSASASPGVLHVYAINNGSTATMWSAGTADAGFNDRVTIGGGTGNAYWVVPLHVEGMMTAPDFRGTGSLYIEGYKNRNPIIGGTAYSIFNGLNYPGNYGSGYHNSERAVLEYGVNNSGPGPSTVASLSVNRTNFVVIPFTFGVSFEFGVWASAYAGEGAYGAFSGQNVTTVDFGNTISYAGGAYAITAGNSVISNLTYSATSGFDYQNAATPEPATWLLSGLGLFVVARYGRRRRNYGRGN